jgi:UMF1 family MFS transporter
MSLNIDEGENEDPDDPQSNQDILAGLGLGLPRRRAALAREPPLFTARESLGLSTGHAAQISLLSASVWWAPFTLIPIRRLRDRRGAAFLADAGVVSAGFRQLRHTLRGAHAYPRTPLFLAAYPFYNDGIQSGILLTAAYAKEELVIGQSTIIVAILLAQFVAFAGALVLGRLAGAFGAKRVVLGCLVIWTLVVAAA